MKAYFTRLLNHLSDEYACLAEASYDAGIERGYSREEAYTVIHPYYSNFKPPFPAARF